jgi:MFS family permease
MIAMLKNKQIAALFLASFAVLYTGMGLFPILPLYAAQFNATNSMIGFYYSIMYTANMLGPVAAGWLISRFSMRTLFIASSMLGLPSLLLLGAAQSFPQVVVLTALLWFSGGMVMSLVSILTGLATDEGSRGKAYSLMAMVAPIGALAGGATIGFLVSWQSYTFMFTALAVIWTAIPVIGLLRLEKAPQGRAQATADRPAAQAPARLGAAFTRILIITFLGAMAVNVSRLGTSLSMQANLFSPEAVSSAGMVSGLIAIPFTLAIGTLSDRLGRKHFMFVSYLFAVSGSLILFNAVALWQFWLASVLLLLAFTVSGAMTQAITGEVVPAQSLSKGLSWLNAISAAANILCFAVGGILFDLLGLPAVFLMAALLALAAAGAIETLVQRERPEAVLQECGEA